MRRKIEAGEAEVSLALFPPYMSLPGGSESHVVGLHSCTVICGLLWKVPGPMETETCREIQSQAHLSQVLVHHAKTTHIQDSLILNQRIEEKMGCVLYKNAHPSSNMISIMDGHCAELLTVRVNVK